MAKPCDEVMASAAIDARLVGAGSSFGRPNRARLAR